MTVPAITIHDARLRQLVALPDGRTGRLVHVSRESRRATVLVGGRRVRIPADELTPIPEPPHASEVH